METQPTLTAGAIQRILNEEDVQKPILQVLGHKKVPGQGTDRYRLLISDGVIVSTFAMLGTQLNHMITNNQLEKFTVIQVDKCVCNSASQAKKIIIILSLKVIAPGTTIGQRIGNPIGMSGTSADSSSGNATVKHEPMNGSTNDRRNENLYGAPMSRSSFDAKPFVQDGMAANIHPISSLTPYQNKWTIKARVTSKPPLRHYSNSRGEGKVFSVTLLDESGEIRATGFNDAADKFYEMLEVNKIYYVSKGNLKTANKTYSSVKNDYEMTFNHDTTIIPCEDNVSSIPMLQFNFVPIAQIEQIEKESAIDVIGICKSASEASTIVTRNTNKEIMKRDIKLVDTSNIDIRLTIWGTDAEKFDPSDNPVVAAKSVRVSDFGGRSLSLVSSSILQINPDIKEAHVLKGWYDREGCRLESTSLSAGSGRNADGNFKNFAQVASENLGMGEKSDYYNIKATIVLVRKENCMYMACPTSDCNKKVIDMNNGMYRCEKCNKEYPNFKWRLMLSMSLADFTENQWVMCFQDAAEAILGISSDELGSLKECDEDKFNEIIADANFKAFTFTLRTKMEVFNEESRLKTQVVSATPIDPVNYGRRLLKEIKQMQQSM